MIRQPFTRAARRAKVELAGRTIGRLDLAPKPGRYTCPICDYTGRFLKRAAVTGARQAAQCPRCGALERHRIQRLVYRQLEQTGGFGGKRVLEFAPESFTAGYLSRHFETHVTADLLRVDVDYRLDITRLPFPDSVFDVVIASHVLEHIPDDRAALAEIARVLSPSGLAVLPVPIVNQTTTEYPTANRFEDYHVRAPGPDYYDRYHDYFEQVTTFRSDDFDDVHQVHLCEDRTGFPAERFPHRQGSAGARHSDIVAVASIPTATATSATATAAAAPTVAADTSTPTAKTATTVNEHTTSRRGAGAD